MVMNTGNTFIQSQHGLLTTLALNAEGKPCYALEGSVFIGGAVMQWLRDGLQLIRHAAESESMAREAGSNGGVYLVPAFVGLGAPHWNMEARGTLVGLTRGTNRTHIVRAALESIAFQSCDVFKAMVADSAGYHNPVFTAMMMFLERKALTGQHFNPLYFIVVVLIENRICTPQAFASFHR